MILNSQINNFPIPEVIKNAPDLMVGLELFYNAFVELNSSRQFGFSEGPIPWKAIHDYCDANEIQGEQRSDLFYFVNEMDSEYLEILREKSK